MNQQITNTHEEFLRHLAEVEEEAQPKREWVKCSDRRPTEKDADFMLEVWWCFKNGFVMRNGWYVMDAFSTHWMPTGLVQPEPPAKET